MFVDTIFIILLNAFVINGLDVNEALPGILQENLGQIVKIEDYFHLAIRLNLTALNGAEIIKIGESLEQMCILYEKKIKKNQKSEECNTILEDYDVFQNTLENKFSSLIKETKTKNIVKKTGRRGGRNKRSFLKDGALILGGMYLYHRLNDLEHGQQEIVRDNLKHLKVMDSTIKYLAETAEKVNIQGQLLNETIEKLNENSYLFETAELRERISNLINAYMLLKMELYSRYSEITHILDLASHDIISTPLIMHEEFKNMLHKSEINSLYKHIINIEKLDPFQIKNLCKITVYIEENIPYVIISFPLTWESYDNLQLVQLKPIPKLENDIATLIKLESDLVVYDSKKVETYTLLKDLGQCKSYNQKYYCYQLNNFHVNNDNCITQILKSRTTKSSELSSCTMTMLKVSGVNVVRMNTINSYMIINTEVAEGKFQDIFNVRNYNITTIGKGVWIVHSNVPGILEFKGFKLEFFSKNQENMKYDQKFDFYSFNYTAPNITVIKDISPIHFKTLSSKNILSIDEVHSLSTEVEHLVEIAKDKLALMTTSNNVIYICILVIVIVIIFAIAIFFLYRKFNAILKLKNVIDNV